MRNAPNDAGVVIRSAREGDREDLVRLYRQGFGAYMRTAPRRRRWGEQRAPWEDTAFRGVVVAEVEGEVVGFACARPADDERLLQHLATRFGAPWLAHDAQHVSAVTVDARHRRKGIAAALVDAATEIAEVQGATGIYAECVEGSGSPQLFQGLGFLPLITTRHGYANGADMTVFALPLPRR